MVMTLNQVAVQEIRAELARKRMSQHELAHRLRWSDMVISKRLRGVKSLSLEELEAIALVLDIPPQRLLWPERLAI